ncbi:MAG: acylase [Gammaproteobacteria bacterium]|nr:acylase [Gammaproteobacteria bacterium]
MNQKYRLILFSAILMLLAACSPKTEVAIDPEFERLVAQAQNITIIRDDFGVPHIYGKTDADAVFGLLYAQAEDDFNRVERNYIWATGRLAEVDGEDAIFSDLRARLYMTVDEAKAAYAAAPDWLKALCDAYADGLNYYLATHPDVKPALLTRFEPWMPMFFSEGSIGGDIEQIDIDGIIAFYGSGKSVQAPGEAQARLVEFAEPKGSNGFAISGDLTESGNTLLLINPHTSFYFRGEVHMVSEEGLNAYGAVTWGQFFVYQGFNENTGWMHTSTRLDFMDEFVEDVFEQDGKLVYRYGDEIRPVEVSEVTLKYKDGATMSERTFPMYHTHHGPVTHMLDGKWVVTKINWDPVNALRQSYTRTKLSGHDEFRKMMDIRTNSSNNTVYADSQGNIAYYHGNFVPRRDTRFDFSKPVDGSNPDTDWQGIHSVDETITLLNPANGWLQNCNSTPFTAAAEFSPKREDYPVYMAPDPETFRGIHAVRVLSRQSGLTLDKLLDLAYDSYLPGFERLIPGLVKAFDESGEDYPELADAVAVLRHWDLRTASDSVAMSLAHFYGLRYGVDGENPQGLRGIELVDYFGNGSPHAERLRIFAATLVALEADFGQWDTPWGEINRFQRLTGDIVQPHDDKAPSLPVGFGSGRWGALASFGAKRYPGTKRIYGSNGNSFVAVVEFGDKVKAKTMLAGGQSGDPDSPHFDDQAQRYVDRQFKDVAFYREDVEKRAERRYHPGEI